MEEKIAAEADTLYAALDQVAEKLGLKRDELDYSFDKDHFRENNRNKPVETVKILAWAKPEQDFTYANLAKEWVEKSLSLLNIEAEVSYKLKSETNVKIMIKSEKGALIVGRKGSTLRAIQHVFLAAMKKAAPEHSFQIDVLGGKKDRGERRRDDRRGKDRDRNKKKGTAELEKLAKKLARKVQDKKEILVMRQTLNAFERRIVHQTVSKMKGVKTESFMDEGIKRIRICPVSEEPSQSSPEESEE